MLGFILRRLATSSLLLFLVLSGTFFLLHLAPGDPIQLGELHGASAETRAYLESLYGLDQPLHRQYLSWLGSVLQGDWGVSFALRRPALTVVLERLPASLLLSVAVILLEHVLGLWIGVAAARRPGGRLDVHSRWSSLLLHAVPSFVVAIVAIEIFAVRLDWLPGQHMTSDEHHRLGPLGRAFDVLQHLILPASALALARFAAVARYVRNGMLDILSQDYIRTARAAGLSERRIFWVHALPNCAGPLVQRLGFSLPGLLSGALILEVIFSWPGIGSVMYDAILGRDYPVVLVATALSATLTIFGHLAADLLYAWIDPRVRDHD